MSKFRRDEKAAISVARAADSAPGRGAKLKLSQRPQKRVTASPVPEQPTKERETADACRQALRDGVTVFCLGLDSMGFPKLVRGHDPRPGRGCQGSGEWTRPPGPRERFSRLNSPHTVKPYKGDLLWLWSSTVTGPNAEKKSAILYHDSPNEQDIPNVARRSTLRAATELPPDNSIKGDRKPMSRCGSRQKMG